MSLSDFQKTETELTEASSMIPLLPTDLPPSLSAETYVYKSADALEEALWSFDEFVKTNAWKWYGEKAHESPGMADVDRVRARQGKYAHLIRVEA
jgi:hypothetical protein